MAGGGSGGIFTPVTDAVGLTDFAGAEQARKSSERAAKKADQVARDRLEFEKEQYDEWKEVFGDIQDNLGEYYKNLTPERITSLGLQNQQREFQAVRREIEKDFTRRGLGGSGIETSTLTNLQMQNALNRARVRTSAPDVVRQQQTSFLGLGLGQLPRIRQGISGAFGQQGQTFLSQSQQEAQRSIRLQESSREAITDTLGAAAGAYAAKKTIPT